MRGLLLYYVILNLACFIIMGWDKLCACRHWRRIPEKVLFLCGLPGGGVGGLLAMGVFRHKIRKPLFWFVYTLEFVLHTIFWILWFRH